MIEDVRVFDWEFGFLCNLNRFNSLNWQLFFNDVGNFEGHFAKDSKLVDLVMRNRYLLLVQGDKQAIVTGYLAGDDFAVYGRTVNWLLTRRVSPVLATETTVTVETYTRGLVADAFSNVSNFALGAVAGYTNPYPFQREKMENLCSVVTAALAVDRAGHEMAFDFSTQQIVYRCVKGVTRPNLVCAAYNAYDMGGSYDMLDFMTSGWYEKSVEGGDPVWTKISGAETGIYEADAVLSGATEADARIALSQRAIKKAYTTKLQRMEFGVDYNLGDTMRLQFEYGSTCETVERRITGVNLSYGSTTEQEPIFEEGM